MAIGITSSNVNIIIHPKGDMVCIDYENGALQVPRVRCEKFITDFCRAMCYIDIDKEKPIKNPEDK